jgi:hypothetical protein
MPLLFYAQFPDPLPDQALFGKQAHEGPNCFVLAESVRAYCTHFPEMAAGQETAPTRKRGQRLLGREAMAKSPSYADSLEPSPLISPELEPPCAPMIARAAGILSQSRRVSKGAAQVLKAKGSLDEPFDLIVNHSLRQRRGHPR